VAPTERKTRHLSSEPLAQRERKRGRTGVGARQLPREIPWGRGCRMRNACRVSVSIHALVSGEMIFWMERVPAFEYEFPKQKRGVSAAAHSAVRDRNWRLQRTARLGRHGSFRWCLCGVSGLRACCCRPTTYRHARPIWGMFLDALVDPLA
jgi:hypothetical protein